MRYVMLIILFFNCCFFSKYLCETMKIESMVRYLYVNNFQQYLTFNSDYNLNIEIEKMENSFDIKGFDARVVYEDGELMITFNKYNKKYQFYLVKNHV